MNKDFKSPQEYLDSLPNERKLVIEKLRIVIKSNLPEGFQEAISYGMLGYVVPHSLYPNGYHCNASLPLPFINVASQKNCIAFYHMGILINPEILNWFVSEYSKIAKSKIDVGKSCIRFKEIGEIPFQLIGELAAKMTVLEWIYIYEKNYKK